MSAEHLIFKRYVGDVTPRERFESWRDLRPGASVSSTYHRAACITCRNADPVDSQAVRARPNHRQSID